MKSWRIFLAVAALVAVPVAGAIAEQRAIRHTAITCFQTVGLSYTVYADLYPPGGAMHDWGIASKWQPSSSTSTEGSTVYCPVTLDVPRAEGTPIELVRIIYSTREASMVTTNAGSNFTPEIKSCSVYLMDGSEDGTWFGQTNPLEVAGGNTGNLFNDGEILIAGSPVALGGPNLRRMLITCQLPRAVSVGGVTTYTGMIKGYEVQYSTTPEAPPQ
jgi:hypothetical protein